MTAGHEGWVRCCYRLATSRRAGHPTVGCDGQLWKENSASAQRGLTKCMGENFVNVAAVALQQQLKALPFESQTQGFEAELQPLALVRCLPPIL